MTKRKNYFYAICFACAVAVALSAVIGARKGETYIAYPEPDFADYISKEVDLYESSTDDSEQTDATKADITVNINTASAAELAALLPGIGEVKANSIVEYRQAVGGFNSVDELIEVRGIGKATLEKIRPYCTI